MRSPLRIDIWSDIACPWCHIGKRRLEGALDELTGEPGCPPIEIEYHSFELAPDTPVDFDGSEVDFLVRHKGLPPDTVEAMLVRVTDIAQSVGLDYRFDRLRHTNTTKAHELLHEAKQQGRQAEVVERLFRAYFTEGRHLGRDEELVELAAEVGLDRDAVTAALRSGEHGEAVRADQEAARRLGIRGVPFFVVDGDLALSGAHPSEVFVDVLHEALARPH